MTDDEARKILVGIIEYQIRGIRNSNGYRDSAEQVATAMLERIPETAQQIALLAYWQNTTGTAVLQLSALKAQYEAHLKRCQRRDEES